jgi:hypothetical protein
MLTEAKIAIDAVAGAIALFDKLYPKIVGIIQNREPTPPSLKIESEGETLVAVSNGQELRRVTYQDLMKALPPGGVSHIKMFEDSMENYKAQIEIIYPQLALLPPVQKAQTQVQLQQMTIDIKGDLLGILDFIRSLGFDLDDHYGVAWSIVNRLGKKDT